MDIYNWESNPRAHRKKVKKTGTVVFHPSLDLQTSFERFLRPQPVLRANPFAVEDHHDDEDEEEEEEEEYLENEDNEDGTKSGGEPNKQRKKVGPTMPLMTKETVENLQQEFGFTALLPSQAQCYKGIFLRRDVLLHSRTGSGKTLAYALPIIERYLLFSARMKHKQQQQHREGGGSEGREEEEGPFLIVFVFSVDLAVQTQGVLSKLYPQLRIEVPGYHNGQEKDSDDGKVSSKKQKSKGKKGKAHEDNEEENEEESRLRRADILIGTVHGIDTVIRGHRIAAEALNAELREEEVEQRLLGQKGQRQPQRADPGDGAPHKKKSKSQNTAGKPEDDGEHEDPNEDEDEDEDDQQPHVAAASGVVSAARVQAIVIDEVDTTLGPRFSSVGRRMKNLLKFIRKSNGALSPGLLVDYRAHHYVLCGATIPNWVIKAGFLGVKKYYYRLVNPGASKLPDGLVCYQFPCAFPERVSTACQLLVDSAHSSSAAVGKNNNNNKSKAKATSSSSSNNHPGVVLGRVVVFGNNKQIEKLTAALEQATTTSSSEFPFYALTARQPEAERIQSITQFNHSKHPCATLLCTDIAARGLDVAGADTILMLSLPMGPMAVETFIHRAGRTARVDRTGRCVVLLEAKKTSSGSGVPVTATTHRAQWEEEQNSLERILQASHVQFQDFASTLGGKTDQRALLQLEVRRPFHAPPRPGAPPLPTAKEVLQRELQLGSSTNNSSSPNSSETAAVSFADWVRDIEEDGEKPTQKVRFTVPMAQVHLVQKKLWKFQLTELGRV